MNATVLTELQLDALREVGGIGAGHAATALSQLVDRPITLRVPRVEILGLGEVARLFGGPEQLVGAVYARLLGDLSGGILLVASRDAAMALADLMHGHQVGTAQSIGRDEERLFQHVGSILVSSYLAAIARMADLNVLPSGASVAFDMAGAVLEAVVSETSMSATQAVLVRTEFVDEGDVIDAALFFVPDPGDLPLILGRLGVA